MMRLPVLSPGTGFVVFLALTLVFLALVVVTGFAAKRRIHIVLVVCTVGALGVTIIYAYALGRVYDTQAAGWITPVHLALARVNTLALLLPVASGVRTIFRPETRRMHRFLAFTVLGLTVLTAITGTVMLSLAPLRST